MDPEPSALAMMFMRVPEVADLVVKHLDPHDIVRLMTKTEPALTLFCQFCGGGIDRLLEISLEGKRKRDRLRRLPSLPRLLEEEWQRKLIGKRLVAKKVEADDTKFRRSDIPRPRRIFSWWIGEHDFRKNRLNVKTKDGIVEHVEYG